MRYKLTSNDISATIDTLGASLVSLCYSGKDMVPHYNADDSRAAGAYLGASIGRTAGRIHRGECEIGGKEYRLDLNSPPNHLHGGSEGFHSLEWECVTASNEEVILQLLSPDGSAGYPANLTTRVKYSLQNNILKIQYTAESDADTLVNLTNHAYFNLSGSPHNLTDHCLRIGASKYLPLNADFVPEGGFADVCGSPFDFREYKRIVASIDADDPQITLAGGYDHCFVLDKGREFGCAASLKYGDTVLDVWTDQIGLVLYTANMMQGVECNNGIYGRRSCIALECQSLPDSARHKAFPDCTLGKGEQYSNTIAFVFNKV